MAATVYYRQGLIGSGSTDLDAITAAGLADGDPSFVFDGTDFYCYRLDANSGAAESSPEVIKPDDEGGDKRWILQGIQGEVQQVPTGVMYPYGGSTAPTNFLLCDGDAVSRSTYSALFTAVGTSFGVGDGSTTFNLPDMRGRVPLGLDNLGGASANRVTNSQADSIGGNNGAEGHVLTTTEMPSHNHTATVQLGTNSDSYFKAGQVSGGGPTAATNSSGGNGSHNNMQPYLSLNYIIRI